MQKFVQNNLELFLYHIPILVQALLSFLLVNQSFQVQIYYLLLIIFFEQVFHFPFPKTKILYRF